MENKLTAVEWLYDTIIIFPESIEDLAHNARSFKQAQQMEKEQNREFYNEGKDFSSYTHDEQYGGVEYWDREPLGFEDYYNEQYGK
jgi:hypothetical protein